MTENIERFKCKIEFLIKLKSVSDNFEKYLENFNEISETHSSNKILDVKNQIKDFVDIKQNRCLIELKGKLKIII